MTTLPYGQVAPISRRAVAYVIDALIAAGLGIVLGGILITVAVLAGSPEGMLGVLLIGGPLVSLALLAWMLLYTGMQSGKGSIGMRAQGVRLVDAASGESIGFWRALLRNVIFGLAGSIVVGYFSPLFDGSGRFQGWHDKVAKSVVLDARAGAASPATTAMPTVATPPAAIPSGYPPPAPQSGASSPYASAGPAHPPAPQYASPATYAPPASAAPAPAQYAAPASTDLPDETIVPPRPPLPAQPSEDASSLIAFVPGVTQDAPPPRASMPATAPTTAPPAPEPTDAPPAAPPVYRASDEPAAPIASAAAPAPVPSFAAPDEDDIEQTRISVPGHRLVFTWDDGARVSVSRRTIFGRNPAPEDGALIVPVRDETLSLSKTHFEAAAETSGGWLLDRNSTNGTTIIRDGEHIECPPGERVRIKLGDVISIGDRIVTVGGYA